MGNEWTRISASEWNWKRCKVCFIILNKSASVFELSNASKCSTALNVFLLVAGVQHYDVCSAEEISLDLGVEDENESSTGASDDVGEGALEEGLPAFVGENSLEAMHGSIVHLFCSSGVHHKSTSDSIERVGDDTSGNSDTLSESPHCEYVSFLCVREHDSLACIEHTKVWGTIGDDSDDRDTKTSVKTWWAVLLKDLHDAVNETIEFTLSTRADVSSESCSGEIKRIDDSQGSGTSSSTRSTVTEEELNRVSLGVVWVEDCLVEVLEGEVQGLGGEIPDDVCEVTSPKGGETLFFNDSREAISNAIISVLRLDCGGSILNLEEELDSLDGGDDCLGDSSGDTTDHEIGHETLLLRGRGRHCV